MNIELYVKEKLKEKKYSIVDLAEHIGINYKTLYGKLNRGKLSAKEFFLIANQLDLDLNYLKDEVALKKVQTRPRKVGNCRETSIMRALKKERESLHL